MTTPTLRRGGQRAADEAAKKKSSSGSYGLWEYFSLDKPADGATRGGVAIVRLITDEPEWVEARMHSFISTKDAPKDKPSDKTWRPKQDATCRYTEGEDGPIYDDCYICDNVRVEDRNGKVSKPYAALRLYAVGVVRKRVKATQEHVDAGLVPERDLGKYPDALIEDEMVEKEIDGKTVKIPHFVVLNYGIKNFFSDFLGFYSVYGSVVDRDYQIAREGTGTDTTYKIVPLDVQYIKGEKFDPRDAGDRYQLPNGKSWSEVLTEIVLNKASDEYYGFFFDPSKNISWESRFGKRDDSKTEAKAEESDSHSSATKEENDAAQEVNNADTIAKMRSNMQATMKDRLQKAKQASD